MRWVGIGSDPPGPDWALDEIERWAALRLLLATTRGDVLEVWPPLGGRMPRMDAIRMKWELAPDELATDADFDLVADAWWGYWHGVITGPPIPQGWVDWKIPRPPSSDDGALWIGLGLLALGAAGGIWLIKK